MNLVVAPCNPCPLNQNKKNSNNIFLTTVLTFFLFAKFCFFFLAYNSYKDYIK